MSAKQIIVLVVLAVADLCVLSLGVALLVMNQPQAAPSPAAVAAQPQATATLTPTATASVFPTPVTPTPEPTNTHWPTWTPWPSETWIPTRTPSYTPTPTPSNTPTPTKPVNTPRPAAGTPLPGGGAPPATGQPKSCQPNNRSKSGKLDVEWTIVSWQQDPADKGRAIGVVQIHPAGGNGGYKYHFLGRDYSDGCIEFSVPKCSSTPTDIIVRSADGQQWKETVIISADDPNFNCK
jgi:hypothetical protein